MALTPYTGTSPPEQRAPAIKPQLVSWTSRIWRHSPDGIVPMFKIDARLDHHDIEDREIAEALRPFHAQLQKIAIYVVHAEEAKRLAPWAIGRFDVDEKSAYMFLHDYLAAPNGMLMLNLLQARGASTELIMGIVPMVVEAKRILFAIPDYDLGVRCQIG
jgi:hypothetical protein